ncbi:ABC transporter ATP-binding protein [Solibacillus sp. FSL H8-0538]|uniref:ABC transporter ATP-binding protein n=1 Tax=Solibacillus sp. FSL H8-0538 TaxID=2921400 RepID=UPI0030FBBD4A
MRNCLIHVKDLEKSFGAKKAVDNISFQIYEGEVVVIIGPNGAGKTTTLNMILGLEQKTTGEINFWTEHYKSLIGVQLQSTPFFPDLTAKENLQLFACFYRKKLTKEEITALFQLCSLADVQNTEVTKLSGGQQKRLSIALAIVHQPSLIFLDEPTAALDPRSRQEIHQTIVNIKNEGKTVVLTSHDMDEASKLADRVLFFYKGAIIAEGSIDELFDKYDMNNLEELYMFLTKEELN